MASAVEPQTKLPLPPLPTQLHMLFMYKYLALLIILKGDNKIRTSLLLCLFAVLLMVAPTRK
jgi:hypothetical protein